MEAARVAQAAEVETRRSQYESAKAELRQRQGELTDAERQLANNRNPDAITRLQLAVSDAEDLFELAEAEALQAEYFYDLLRAQQEEEAMIYADMLRDEADADRENTEERIDYLIYEFEESYA